MQKPSLICFAMLDDESLVRFAKQQTATTVVLVSATVGRHSLQRKETKKKERGGEKSSQWIRVVSIGPRVRVAL